MKSPDLPPVEFRLDGQPVQALAGETILQAATRVGVAIPHLCFQEGMRPDGNCRACVVEIDGERVLAPSCCRLPAAGMEVQASSERARKSQKLVLELLLADMPEEGYKWNDANARVPLTPTSTPRKRQAFFLGTPEASPSGGGRKKDLSPRRRRRP